MPAVKRDADFPLRAARPASHAVALRHTCPGCSLRVSGGGGWFAGKGPLTCKNPRCHDQGSEARGRTVGVNDSRLFDIGGRRVEIRGDGEGVVSHAGVALLSGLADRVGLTAALGARPRARRRRASAHDPGEVLRDVAVALADGSECVSDLAVLRDQPE
ncbi:MAG: hypothetical protein GEU78_15345, partial [Actinobacteria bacterium]|nr:hypothetical protein [Actinomycetota bacterium]